MVKVFTFSKNCIRHKDSLLACCRCGYTFRAGDQVVSLVQSRTGTKRYHSKCYDTMLLDV